MNRNRVLVMDDDKGVRDVARAILTRLQCEVEVAGSRDEAIEHYRIARLKGTPFNLVILDLSMKVGKGGLETLKDLQEIDPGVRAVISSGFSSDPVVKEYQSHGFSGVMPKPYRITDVEELLHDLFGARK